MIQIALRCIGIAIEPRRRLSRRARLRLHESTCKDVPRERIPALDGHVLAYRCGACRLLFPAEDCEGEDDPSYEELLREFPRPRTRGDCINGPRPCPWVSCRHNLFLDVEDEGKRVKLNFAILEEMTCSCALDFVDARGGDPVDCEDLGPLFGVTGERVRQILWEAAGSFPASMGAIRKAVRGAVKREGGK